MQTRMLTSTSHPVVVLLLLSGIALVASSPLKQSFDGMVAPLPRAVRFGIFDPKRSGARGFEEGIFDEGFGHFTPVKKNEQHDLNEVGYYLIRPKPEMTSRGIHGDAFTGGFGEFQTMKRLSDYKVAPWNQLKL